MNKNLTLLLAPAVALAIPLVVFAACSGEDKSKPKMPTTSNAVTVDSVTVELGSVQSWTFAEGTARAVRREYLTFEDPGLITFVEDGLREGSVVKAGAVLVRQDQRRLKAEIETAKAAVIEAQTKNAVAEAELAQMKTDEQFARTTFERFATLLKKNSASPQEYDEAKARADKAAAAVTRAESQVLAAKAGIAAAEARVGQSEVELEQTELRTPIDGIVARLNVQKGYYMSPSLLRTDSEEAFLQTVPVLVIDPGSLEITVDIPPSQQHAIAEGKEAYIQVGGDALASDGEADFDPTTFPFTGKVYSVTPSVSPGKRAVQVKIRTDEGSERLQDGMFVTVWINAERRDQTVKIPSGTLVYRDNHPHVFVIDPDSKRAELRAVEVGLSGLNEQEIVGGLAAGELVVTTGRYQISDGTPIQLIENPAASTTAALEEGDGQ